MKEEDLSPAEVLEETDWPHLREKTEDPSLRVLPPSDLKEQRREQYSLIGNVMRCLSREERKVVRLRFFHNLSWAEIASQLNITTGKACRYHSSAVDKMREAMAQLKAAKVS
jgi:RNA polymerase sigma factor (sigma-70 family)